MLLNSPMDPPLPRLRRRRRRRLLLAAHSFVFNYVPAIGALKKHRGIHYPVRRRRRSRISPRVSSDCPINSLFFIIYYRMSE